MNIRNLISNSVHNLKSEHSNRKIVVFQSDDWGAIRTPSKEDFTEMIKLGVALDRDVYSRNDALEDQHDLERLFDVLTSIKDKNGHHPVFTANYVIANPDFDRIKEDNFENYHYETIEYTYQRYYAKNLITGICKEGIESNIWHPQCHGREHLNVALWMSSLKQGYPEIKKAFDHKMFALTKSLVKNFNYSFMEAFNARSIKEAEQHREIIKDSILIFTKIFGYKPSSFIAPNYVWGNIIEEELSNNDVNIIQCGKVQKFPHINNNKIIHHPGGSKNNRGQIYKSRNCDFEPTTGGGEKALYKCLSDIQNAFIFKTPAIINTHRINYISSISSKNGEKNLHLLKRLLSEIIKKWPDVEFYRT